MNINSVLERVKNGELSVEEAEKMIRFEPIIELGYASLDGNREARQGFPETVYCAGKPLETLTGIFASLYEANGRVLGTRCSTEQAAVLLESFPDAFYDAVSGVFILGERSVRSEGNICVISAGTSDMMVSEEAALCSEFFGAHVNRVYDCGVSGIHRLLSKTDILAEANCVIVIAGMEGALASVVAGLVSVPVIAVPTSVGYGASYGGLAAFLSMVNSCANGVSVVNIDNGYGAAYNACMINRLAVSGS